MTTYHIKHVECPTCQSEFVLPTDIQECPGCTCPNLWQAEPNEEVDHKRFREVQNNLQNYCA